MDHSLRSYLERHSTEELDAILKYIVNNDVYGQDEVVRTILAIIEEREKDIKPEITPEIRAAWERYLEKTEQLQNKQDT